MIYQKQASAYKTLLLGEMNTKDTIIIVYLEEKKVN